MGRHARSMDLCCRSKSARSRASNYRWMKSCSRRAGPVVAAAGTQGSISGSTSSCGMRRTAPAPVSLHLFPSMCFVPCVSRLSATRRRPGFGCFPGVPPGLWRKGSPALRAGLPFLDLPPKAGGLALAGSLECKGRGGGNEIDGQELGTHMRVVSSRMEVTVKATGGEQRVGGGRGGTRSRPGCGSGLKRFWWFGWRRGSAGGVCRCGPLTLGIGTTKASRPPFPPTSGHTRASSLRTRVGARARLLWVPKSGRIGDTWASLGQRPMADQAFECLTLDRAVTLPEEL
jgi:hypothetical protein